MCMHMYCACQNGNQRVRGQGCWLNHWALLPGGAAPRAGGPGGAQPSFRKEESGRRGNAGGESKAEERGAACAAPALNGAGSWASLFLGTARQRPQLPRQASRTAHPARKGGTPHPKCRQQGKPANGNAPGGGQARVKSVGWICRPHDTWGQWFLFCGGALPIQVQPRIKGPGGQQPWHRSEAPLGKGSGVRRPGKR
ncbi:MAG: hypothetical protein J3K34DRAFT_92166 [Monoraphidium minutum]|nr:MAG: hypothetical protein J3K34DRAFT_92166 [Monoraphidium minutum]